MRNAYLYICLRNKNIWSSIVYVYSIMFIGPIKQTLEINNKWLVIGCFIVRRYSQFRSSPQQIRRAATNRGNPCDRGQSHYSNTQPHQFLGSLSISIYPSAVSQSSHGNWPASKMCLHNSIRLWRSIFGNTSPNCTRQNACRWEINITVGLQCQRQRCCTDNSCCKCEGKRRVSHSPRAHFIKHIAVDGTWWKWHCYVDQIKSKASTTYFLFRSTCSCYARRAIATVRWSLMSCCQNINQWHAIKRCCYHMLACSRTLG